MANTLSATMTDILASPVVKQPAGVWHGRVRAKFSGVIAVDAADANGHIYPSVRMRASDRIISVLLRNGTITTGTDYDLGVYEAGDWGIADQAVVDVNAIADAIDMSTARTVTEIIEDSIAIALWGTPIWQMAGVAAEPTPGTEYDICWTGVAVGSASESIVTAILYTAGD